MIHDTTHEETITAIEAVVTIVPVMEIAVKNDNGKKLL